MTPLSSFTHQEFHLCDSGNMVFHWADFFETCDQVASEMERNPKLLEDFKIRKNALHKLSHIPVWIKTSQKIYQMSVFDVYEKFILNQIQDEGIDPFCPLEISFISQTGPFKTMSVAECFNRTTYYDFVMMYLIEEKLPRRDYRIRLKSRILMEYGPEFTGAEVVSLEQMSMKGILISMNSEIYLKKISPQESVRFLVNSRLLSQSKGKNLKELRDHLGQYAYNLLYTSSKDDSITCKLKDFSIQSAFDFAQDKKVYLFITYENLAKNNPQSVKMMKDFVVHTRELIRGNYPRKYSELTA